MKRYFAKLVAGAVASGVIAILAPPVKAVPGQNFWSGKFQSRASALSSGQHTSNSQTNGNVFTSAPLKTYSSPKKTLGYKDGHWRVIHGSGTSVSADSPTNANGNNTDSAFKGTIDARAIIPYNGARSAVAGTPHFVGGISANALVPGSVFHSTPLSKIKFDHAKTSPLADASAAAGGAVQTSNANLKSGKAKLSGSMLSTRSGAFPDIPDLGSKIDDAMKNAGKSSGGKAVGKMKIPSKLGDVTSKVGDASSSLALGPITGGNTIPGGGGTGGGGTGGGATGGGATGAGGTGGGGTGAGGAGGGQNGGTAGTPGNPGTPGSPGTPGNSPGMPNTNDHPGFPWWKFGGGYSAPVIAYPPSNPVIVESPVVVESAEALPRFVPNTMAPAPSEAPVVDLELLSVQLIDGGDPGRKLGPRYRATFRNNGTVAAGNFQVLLMASRDGSPHENDPATTAEVVELAAGETSSVDVRLPLVADPGTYVALIAAVDSGDQITEIDEENNAAALDRSRIAMLP